MPEMKRGFITADRSTPLSNLRRCTREETWKRFNGWFQFERCRKKCDRVAEKHNPTQVISRIEKSTAHFYFQRKIAHAIIGLCLNRIDRTDDDACWWCLAGVVQPPEHTSNNCTRWYQNQEALWQAARSGRSMTNTSIKELLWDKRCSKAVSPYLRATEIDADVVSEGRKTREQTPEGGDLSF
jgi:hypothetical protein